MRKAWIPGDAGSYISIGDVNSDGFGDVAIATHEGRLKIYLGQDLNSTVSIAQQTDLSLTFKSQHLASTENVLECSLVIDHPATYQIDVYSLDGKHITTLMKEQFDEGSYTRSIMLDASLLSAGLYNLRLSDGRRSVDKGFLILK